MKNWDNQYEDYIFGGAVPLYLKYGTQLYGSDFKIGDPVYLPESNEIGFIINGPTTFEGSELWGDEVRTDVSGVQSCFTAFEPKHLSIPNVYNPYTSYPDVIEFLTEYWTEGQKWIVSTISSDGILCSSVMGEEQIARFIESELEGESAVKVKKCCAEFQIRKKSEGVWYAFELSYKGIFFQKLPE